MKYVQGVLKEHFLFVFLLGVFIVTPIAYFSYVPIWDGYQFAEQCYIPAASSIQIACALHSSLFNNFIFGSIQKLDPGNSILIYGENLVLGVVGLIFFYLVLSEVFEDRLSAYERALMTFLFGFQPVFLAQILQPGLDYLLPIYAVILVFFLLNNNFVGASILGLMLEFTKESGFMVYGVCVLFYFLVFVGIGKRKEIVTQYRNTIPLLIVPVICLAYYMRFYATQAAMRSGTLSHLLLQMFSTNMTDSFFIGQLKSIAVINFYWVVTFAILYGAIFFIYKNAKRNISFYQLKQFELRVIYICLCSVLILWFITRIEFFNTPRYMLVWVPFLVLTFASVYILMNRNTPRLASLSLLVFLVYISAFRTIDPVSQTVFPVFYFGEHKMLQPDPVGRDTLVYNFQFTAFDYLAEKAMRTIGLERNYVLSSTLTWYGFADFATYNKESGHRTLLIPENSPKTMRVNVMDEEQAVADKKIREVYFISMPAHDSEGAMRTLSGGFKAVGTTTVEEDGYALDVIQYARK